MGLKNFRILILKIPKLSAFQMAGSSLFHSIIADGKKLFLKKLCLILIRGVQSTSLIFYIVIEVILTLAVGKSSHWRSPYMVPKWLLSDAPTQK